MHSKHFHFSGICGTGMASLAVLLQKRGHKVTGSDQNIYPPMSTLLEENSIPVFQGYRAENLQPHPDCVVIGNALSRGNPEVEYTLETHLYYLSMAEILKNEFIRGNRSIVVTGTHGKTTTTSIAAHMLEVCGKKPGFFIGGISRNFGTSARDTQKGGYFVIEGDEYDTSFFDKRSKFFHYLPDILILNNLEFDHGDIFSSLDEIKKSFSLMLRQIPQNGLILVNGDDPDALEVAKTGFCQVITFGFGEHCDAILYSRKPLGGDSTQFEMRYRQERYHWTIPMIGEFNIRNMAGVILLCLCEGLSSPSIQKGLQSFKRPKRRLQLVSKNKSVKVFDDFAHHPTAIASTIQAIHESWPDAKIHAIYEPRSNTSVRRFHQEKMAQAFESASRVTFYRLFREEKIKPEDRLDLSQIIEELKQKGQEAKVLKHSDRIVEDAVEKAEPGDIVLVMSQGDFEGIQQKIANKLDRKWADSQG